MNASASGAERPDIRVGDLIKATLKKDGESSWQGRVIEAGAWVYAEEFCANPTIWDFEVLDRPLPPISEELLRGAMDLYCTLRGLTQVEYTRDGITAVINFVRDYDRKNATKENSK